MAVSSIVELAHEPNFVLGRLTVSPSRRELVRDDREREVIEHRVMQVLIALNRARGEIVTRDELIQSCWHGRVVGEDSINRALSLLRKVASGIGAGSIDVETIIKVGYRLTTPGEPAVPGDVLTVRPLPPAGELESSHGWSRRRALIGGSIALLAAGGGAIVYRRWFDTSIPPEVRALVGQARQLRDQNTREAQYQAIGLLRRVVEIAPGYADGWGMLGCAYAIPSHYREQPEALTLRSRAEAAGQRALQIDPGNAYGELALSIALPFIGHWLERDRRLERALANRPVDDEMLAFRAVALIFVGRSREAIRYYDKIRGKPFSPAVYNNYIHALWSAGMIEETDRAIADAASLYPTQSTIWVTRFHVNMFSGRPNAAIALAEDLNGRPTDVGGPALQGWIDQARAIESRDPKQVESIRLAQMERARASAFGAEYAIRVLSALDRVDDAFTVAHAYYFERRFSVPDVPDSNGNASLDQRQTRILFEPVTRPMRADVRMNSLVEDIGLEKYWRDSGVPPDFRRS